jgi:hypothetical protein
MEATRSISELRSYLDKFKEDMSQIDIRHLEEIPKFSLPNWPKNAGSINVVLRFKVPFSPVGGHESNLLNLKRKLFRKIVFGISETGIITVHLFLLFDGWYDETTWKSDSSDSMKRTKCFIMLSQFLDPVCSKVISRLKRRYTSYKLEAEEFNQICEAVKRSFEPLIPFVVADILGNS